MHGKSIPPPTSSELAKLSPTALYQQKKRIVKSLESARGNRKIRLGMYGVPNSGKTSLLIAWYLFRDDPDLDINIKFKEATLVYLRDVANFFLEHGTTQANAATPPNSLEFKINYRGESYEFSTIDYAGKYVTPMDEDDGIRELASDARDFVDKCTAILALLDCNANSTESIDAIDLMPENKPVVFAPTKVDELLDDPHRILDYSKEEAKEVYEFVKENSFVKKVERQITNGRAHNRVACIPISPLGPLFHNGKIKMPLPIKMDILRPWNIYSPLKILMDSLRKYEKSRKQDLRETLNLVENEIKNREAKKQQKEIELRQELEVIDSQLRAESSILRPGNTSIPNLQRIQREAKQYGFDSLETKADGLVRSIKKQGLVLPVIAILTLTLIGCAALVLIYLF